MFILIEEALFSYQIEIRSRTLQWYFQLLYRKRHYRSEMSFYSDLHQSYEISPRQYKIMEAIIDFWLT